MPILHLSRDVRDHQPATLGVPIHLTLNTHCTVTRKLKTIRTHPPEQLFGTLWMTYCLSSFYIFIESQALYVFLQCSYVHNFFFFSFLLMLGSPLFVINKESCLIENAVQKILWLHVKQIHLEKRGYFWAKRDPGISYICHSISVPPVWNEPWCRIFFQKNVCVKFILVTFFLYHLSELLSNIRTSLSESIAAIILIMYNLIWLY